MFGSEGDHTLNYNIRILGRRGVLVLNAVSGMKQLDAIRAQTVPFCRPLNSTKVTVTATICLVPIRPPRTVSVD
jgi:hypothetical protein